MDFQFDNTIDGRPVKLLNVVDEYTRECPAIVVERSIDADRVVATLARLATERGEPPAYVRFDNGPEFVSHAIADRCRFNDGDTCFIDPGSPWQNAWTRSFNGRLRDDFLNGWQFDSLFQAQVLIEDWRIDYNINRPHCAHRAHGDLTPTEFALAWNTRNQPALASHLDHSTGTPQGPDERGEFGDMSSEVTQSRLERASVTRRPIQIA